MPHIFISYSKKDTRALATALHEALSRLPGVTAWMDTILEPDASWTLQIEENIDRADYVIVLLSSDVNRPVTPTQRRSFVLNEIDYANDANKPILPVMVERTKTPVSIAGTQYIDLTATPSDPAAIVSRVIERFSIASPPPQTQQQAAPPVVPAQPQPTKAQLVDTFYAALDAGDFARAGGLLDAIEQRGVPPGFPLKDWRQDVAEGIAKQKAADEQARFESERSDAYGVLRRLVGRGHDERIFPALEDFWQHYPGYDPDNLARFNPDPLVRARTFTGARNADWVPFVATFPKLSIPDMRFCLVPRGSFIMGEGDQQHPQTIAAPFWIAQYPVTNAQWKEAVKAGVVKPPTVKYDKYDTGAWYNDPAMADAPVAGISWHQAQAFVGWLGVRLPTELEWEFAARGVESWVYPWGNAWQPENAVYDGNSGDRPSHVASRPGGASWVGARQLSGNVWEWASSGYHDYPYAPDDGREDVRRNDNRVVRGGSFSHVSNFLGAATRYVSNPTGGSDSLGFRCALSP